MKISDVDKQIILAWVNQRCGQMRCTCCGHGNWMLLDSACHSIGFDLRTTRFFCAQGIPQVAVACTNCGHILFFSPLVMGIQPQAPVVVEPVASPGGGQQ